MLDPTNGRDTGTGDALPEEIPRGGLEGGRLVVGAEGAGTEARPMLRGVGVRP